MANSVNVIVTSLTVTECCVNLFLSMIRPVLPVEVGGTYLIKLPLISIGVELLGDFTDNADDADDVDDTDDADDDLSLILEPEELDNVSELVELSS